MNNSGNVTIRYVNPRSVLKRANKTSILKIGMTTDGNHACIPKLGGEFHALPLVLVLLSRPEVWLESRSRLGIPCRLIWKPILLDTAGRYHEYHATIHWKHESGWSVGIGWLISDRACAHLSASGSYEPTEDCVCIQAGLAGCRFCFIFLQSRF